MTPTRDKLLACFSTVFPKKSAQELSGADIDNLSEWDSSGHILLMQVIEEQFGFPIADDAMGEMTSFSALEEYLEKHGRPH